MPDLVIEETMFSYVISQPKNCIMHEHKFFTTPIHVFIYDLLPLPGHVIRKVTSQEPCEFGWILCREKPTYAYICLYEQRKFGFSYLR